jgi:hypothetical protein
MISRSLLFAILVASPLTPGRSQLARRYVVGDTVVYVMNGLNSDGRDTTRYQAAVAGLVVRDSIGRFAEQLSWTRLDRNGTSVTLDSSQAHQTLTLAPDWQLLPDLRHVSPALVGPELDLFTFYVDAKLAAAQAGVRNPGDSIRLPLGVGGSWADGQSVLLGKDAVDFEIKLLALTPDRATVQVRHVPPHSDKLDLPTDWMREPVGQGPNNWVEVVSRPDRHYRARIGSESFDVELQISRPDGRLLAVAMQNPVDVVERDCDDRALTVCGPPRRYRISRVITLQGR